MVNTHQCIAQLEEALADLQGSHASTATAHQQQAQQDFAKQLGAGLASRLQAVSFNTADVSRILAYVQSTLTNDDLLGQYNKALQLPSVSDTCRAVECALEALRHSSCTCQAQTNSLQQQGNQTPTSCLPSQPCGEELCSDVLRQLHGLFEQYKDTGKQLTALGEQVDRARAGITDLAEQLQASPQHKNVEALDKATSDLDALLMSLANLICAHDDSENSFGSRSKAGKALRALQKQFDAAASSDAVSSDGSSQGSAGKLKCVIAARQAWDAVLEPQQRDTSEVSSMTAQLGKIRSSMQELSNQLSEAAEATLAVEVSESIHSSYSQLQLLGYQQQKQLAACDSIKQQLDELFGLVRTNSSSGGCSADHSSKHRETAVFVAAPEAHATRRSTSGGDLEYYQAGDIASSHLGAQAATALAADSSNHLRPSSRLGMPSRSAAVSGNCEAAWAIAVAPVKRRSTLASVPEQGPADSEEQQQQEYEHTICEQLQATSFEAAVQVKLDHSQQNPLQHSPALQQLPQQNQKASDCSISWHLQEMQCLLTSSVSTGAPLPAAELLHICNTLQQLVQHAQDEQSGSHVAPQTGRASADLTIVPEHPAHVLVAESNHMLRWSNPVFSRDSEPEAIDSESCSHVSSPGGSSSSAAQATGDEVKGMTTLGNATAAHTSDSVDSCRAGAQHLSRSGLQIFEAGLDIAVDNQDRGASDESATPHSLSDPPYPPSRLESLSKPPSSKDMDAAAAAAAAAARVALCADTALEQLASQQQQQQQRASCQQGKCELARVHTPDSGRPSDISISLAEMATQQEDEALEDVADMRLKLQQLQQEHQITKQLLADEEQQLAGLYEQLAAAQADADAGSLHAADLQQQLEATEAAINQQQQDIQMQQVQQGQLREQLQQQLADMQLQNAEMMEQQDRQQQELEGLLQQHRQQVADLQQQLTRAQEQLACSGEQQASAPDPQGQDIGSLQPQLTAAMLQCKQSFERQDRAEEALAAAGSVECAVDESPAPVRCPSPLQSSKLALCRRATYDAVTSSCPALPLGLGTADAASPDLQDNVETTTWRSSPCNQSRLRGNLEVTPRHVSSSLDSSAPRRRATWDVNSSSTAAAAADAQNALRAIAAAHRNTSGGGKQLVGHLLPDGTVSIEPEGSFPASPAALSQLSDPPAAVNEPGLCKDSDGHQQQQRVEVKPLLEAEPEQQLAESESRNNEQQLAAGELEDNEIHQMHSLMGEQAPADDSDGKLQATQAVGDATAAAAAAAATLAGANTPQVGALQQELTSLAAQLADAQLDLQQQVHSYQLLMCKLAAANSIVLAAHAQLAALSATVRAGEAAGVAEAIAAADSTSQSDEMMAAQLRLAEQLAVVQQLMVRLQQTEGTLAAARAHLNAVTAADTPVGDSAVNDAMTAVELHASKLADQSTELQAAVQQLLELLHGAQHFNDAAAEHSTDDTAGIPGAPARIEASAMASLPKPQSRQENTDHLAGAAEVSKMENLPTTGGDHAMGALHPTRGTDSSALQAPAPGGSGAHSRCMLRSDDADEVVYDTSSIQLQAELALVLQQLTDKQQELQAAHDWADLLALGLSRIKQALGGAAGDHPDCLHSAEDDFTLHQFKETAAGPATAALCSALRADADIAAISAAAGVDIDKQGPVACLPESKARQLLMLHELQRLADQVCLMSIEQHAWEDAHECQHLNNSRLQEVLQAMQGQLELQEEAAKQLEEHQVLAAADAAQQLYAAAEEIAKLQQLVQEQDGAALEVHQAFDAAKGVQQLKEQQWQQQEREYQEAAAAAASEIASLQQQLQKQHDAEVGAQQELLVLAREQHVNEKQWLQLQKEYQDAAAAAADKITDLQQQVKEQLASKAEVQQQLQAATREQQLKQQQWLQQDRDYQVAAAAAAEEVAKLQQQMQQLVHHVVPEAQNQQVAQVLEQQLAKEAEWQHNERQHLIAAAIAADQITALQQQVQQQRRAADEAMQKLEVAVQQQKASHQQYQEQFAADAWRAAEVQRQLEAHQVAASAAAEQLAAAQAQQALMQEELSATQAANAVTVQELQVQLEAAQAAAEHLPLLQAEITALNGQLRAAGADTRGLAVPASDYWQRDGTVLQFAAVPLSTEGCCHQQQHPQQLTALQAGATTHLQAEQDEPCMHITQQPVSPLQQQQEQLHDNTEDIQQLQQQLPDTQGQPTTAELCPDIDITTQSACPTAASISGVKNRCQVDTSLQQRAAELESVLLEVQAESAAKDKLLQKFTQLAELRMGAGYARTEELRRLYRDMATKDAYISQLETRLRAIAARTPSPAGQQQQQTALAAAILRHQQLRPQQASAELQPAADQHQAQRQAHSNSSMQTSSTKRRSASVGANTQAAPASNLNRPTVLRPHQQRELGHKARDSDKHHSLAAAATSKPDRTVSASAASTATWKQQQQQQENGQDIRACQVASNIAAGYKGRATAHQRRCGAVVKSQGHSCSPREGHSAQAG